MSRVKDSNIGKQFAGADMRLLAVLGFGRKSVLFRTKEPIHHGKDSPPFLKFKRRTVIIRPAQRRTNLHQYYKYHFSSEVDGLRYC